MKRVLLLGGSGQLGTAIATRWNDCEVLAPEHEELAIENTERLKEAIARTRPEVVVNAAAFHDVDRCEKEPARAFEINARAAGDAARVVAQSDALFVTISTDYVFDGRKGAPYTEADAPNPLSVYGASRLAGERLVEESGARAFIVRTCGLYGAARSRTRRASFVERIVRQAADGAPVRVVADVVASPTYAGDLADALRALIETAAYGLFHAAGAGAVSWYDFADAALAQAGVSAPIEPITSADRWTTGAARPRYSALENARLREVGIALRAWRQGLAAYFGSSVDIGVR